MKVMANFVNWPVWQLTQREMLRLMNSGKFMLGFVAVTLLLGFAAPFETGVVLALPQRILYWAGVAVVTYAIGFATQRTAVHYFAIKGWSPFVSVPLAGLISSPFIYAFMVFYNVYLTGVLEGTRANLVEHYFTCLAVALVVGIVSHLLLPQMLYDLAKEEERAEAAPEPVRPALFDKLPEDKQAPILSLRGQDHYVEVTTEKGQELVLMRLSDAIQSTGCPDGVQIHRSAYVCRIGVVAFQKEGKKAHVELRDGRRLSVARARIPDVQEWWENPPQLAPLSASRNAEMARVK